MALCSSVSSALHPFRKCVECVPVAFRALWAGCLHAPNAMVPASLAHFLFVFAIQQPNVFFFLDWPGDRHSLLRLFAVNRFFRQRMVLCILVASQRREQQWQGNLNFMVLNILRFCRSAVVGCSGLWGFYRGGPHVPSSHYLCGVARMVAHFWPRLIDMRYWRGPGRSPFQILARSFCDFGDRREFGRFNAIPAMPDMFGQLRTAIREIPPNVHSTPGDNRLLFAEALRLGPLFPGGPEARIFTLDWNEEQPLE